MSDSAPSQQSRRPKLRTKTGCLTCRVRRIKCNERRPLGNQLWPPPCKACTRTGRHCTWPADQDISDRRSRSQRVVGSYEYGQLSLLSDSITAKTARLDLESTMLQHFFDTTHPQMYSRDAHPGYPSFCARVIIGFGKNFEAVRDAIIANGAAHFNANIPSPRLYDLSLVYYSNAISKVSLALQSIGSNGDVENDALVLAVTALYTHGFWSFDTGLDIPKHVAGAIQLLKFRSEHHPENRPFDRILTERIMLQIFRMVVYLPCSCDVEPYIEFWSQSEELMQTLTFPEASTEANSPVMGIPHQLPHFIIRLIAFARGPYQDADAGKLARFAEEMLYWETRVGVNDPQTDSNDLVKTLLETDTNNYHLSTTLYVLAASLLLDQISVPRAPADSADAGFEYGWQMRLAMDVLKNPTLSENWSKCFMGVWPMFVFGFTATAEEDRALIKSDLSKRWEYLRGSEAVFAQNELESFWEGRQSDQQPAFHEDGYIKAGKALIPSGTTTRRLDSVALAKEKLSSGAVKRPAAAAAAAGAIAGPSE